MFLNEGAQSNALNFKLVFHHVIENHVLHQLVIPFNIQFKPSQLLPLKLPLRLIHLSLVITPQDQFCVKKAFEEFDVPSLT